MACFPFRAPRCVEELRAKKPAQEPWQVAPCVVDAEALPSVMLPFMACLLISCTWRSACLSHWEEMYRNVIRPDVCTLGHCQQKRPFNRHGSQMMADPVIRFVLSCYMTSCFLSPLMLVMFKILSLPVAFQL